MTGVRAAPAAVLALLSWTEWSASAAEPTEEAIAHRVVAEASYKKGDNELAARAARACLELAPDDQRCKAVLVLTGSDGRTAPRSGVQVEPETIDNGRVRTLKEPGATPTSEENKRSALQHWNAGLIYFQQGKFEKARDEWTLCGQLDPENSDCPGGLERIDGEIGGIDPVPRPTGGQRRKLVKITFEDEETKAIELVKKYPLPQHRTTVGEWLTYMFPLPVDSPNPWSAKQVGTAYTVAFRMGQPVAGIEPIVYRFIADPAKGTVTGANAQAQNLLASPPEENKRSAISHWNAGLIYFQQGQYEKARDEWTLCKQLDSGNADCVDGLRRIDLQFGGIDRAAPPRIARDPTTPLPSAPAAPSGPQASPMAYHVGFLTNTETMTQTGDQSLQQIADMLAYYPQVNLDLVGHASKEEINAKALAENRVRQVSSLLVNKHNVDSRRIQIQTKVGDSAASDVEVNIVSGRDR